MSPRLISPAPTPHEAAAIIAAIERFEADHRPAAAPAPAPRHSPWQRTALLEGVDRAPGTPA
jgi:hypothetical protein